VEKMWGNTVYDTDDLILELVHIGRAGEGKVRAQNGANFVHGSKKRVREIGRKLDRLGGIDLMVAARGAVQSHLGRSAAQHLEATWRGIGQWEADIGGL
jgi:hypothetical protein